MDQPAVETWRTSTLHPLYQVSNLGNVRRLWLSDTKCLVRPLKPYIGRHNYLKVQLGYRGPRIYVHTLVALTFLGPRPDRHDVDHIDFDRHNNAVTNLRYLPHVINSVRWASRVNGKNVWELAADEPAPEDHVPMSEQELDDVARAAAEFGW